MKLLLQCKIVVVGLLLVSGCASLTETQMKSISTFSREYSKLGLTPGNIIRSNTDVQFLDHRLAFNEDRVPDLDKIRDKVCAAGCDSLAEMYNEIVEYKELQNAHARAAKALDAILIPIEKYIVLLGSVADTDYNEGLSESSQALASSLNSALTEIPKNISSAKNAINAGVANTTAEKVFIAKDDIAKASSYLGTMTYWLGKAYVRQQQTRALEIAVTASDPVISTVIDDLTAILDIFTDEKSPIRTIGRYKEYVPIMKQITNEKTLKLRSTIDNAGLTEDSYKEGLTSGTETKIQLAISKGVATKKALEAFKKAHNSLALSLQEDPSGEGGKVKFADFLDSTQTMINEIKEVREFQKELEEALLKKNKNKKKTTRRVRHGWLRKNKNHEGSNKIN